MLALSAIRNPSIARERRRLIRDIKRSVAPYLYDSGYSTRKDMRKCRFAEGNRRPLKLWVHRKADGKLSGKTWKLRGTYVVGEIEGLAEDGLITDHGLMSPAIVTTAYASLPLEDLLKVMDWVRFTFLPLVQPKAA